MDNSLRFVMLSLFSLITLAVKWGKQKKATQSEKKIYKILFCRLILNSQNKQQMSPDVCVNK